MSEIDIRKPSYYTDGHRYEPKDVIRQFNLNFNVGNTVKYIVRAGKKDPDKYLEDLNKASVYLSFELLYLGMLDDGTPTGWSVKQPKSIAWYDRVSEILDDWNLKGQLRSVVSKIFSASRTGNARDVMVLLSDAKETLESYIDNEMDHRKNFSRDYETGWNDAMKDVMEYMKAQKNYFIATHEVIGHCNASQKGVH